jgi:formate hydrogenlyase subunit 6/NADH:ubiquinone oxidoreductase subunit I
MQNVMLKCPTTGKLVFTEIRVPDNFKPTHFLRDSKIIPCLHCGQDHDIGKEQILFIPDVSDGNTI